MLLGLVNARSLQFKCARFILHGSLLVPVLTYSSETMLWKGGEIRSVQMNNLKGSDSRGKNPELLKAA